MTYLYQFSLYIQNICMYTCEWQCTFKMSLTFFFFGMASQFVRSFTLFKNNPM